MPVAQALPKRGVVQAGIVDVDEVGSAATRDQGDLAVLLVVLDPPELFDLVEVSLAALGGMDGVGARAWACAALVFGEDDVVATLVGSSEHGLSSMTDSVGDHPKTCGHIYL